MSGYDLKRVGVGLKLFRTDLDRPLPRNEDRWMTPGVYVKFVAVLSSSQQLFLADPGGDVYMRDTWFEMDQDAFKQVDMNRVEPG